MEKKKVAAGLLTAAQIILAAGVTAAAVFLLWRYGQYGERGEEAMRADGAQSEAERDTPGNTGGESEETIGAVRGEMDEEEAMREPGGDLGASDSGASEKTDEKEAMREPGGDLGASDSGASEKTDEKEAMGNTGEEFLIETVEGESGEALPETIRVRILTTNFSEDCHQEVELSCAEGLLIAREGGAEDGRSEKGGEEAEEAAYQSEETGNKTAAYQSEETGNKTADYQSEEAGNGTAAYFGQGAEAETTVCRNGEIYRVKAEDMEEGERILAQSAEPGGKSRIAVSSLERADGVPEYGGKLYLIREKEGIALINELPLEEYLQGVVPSEMPSDYPMEAQKAQAVCARTYAVNCIRQRDGKNFLEDLNDSVDFQVYNNYRSCETSKAAVEATKGEILPLSEVLYYSTSCLSEQREDLADDEAFCAFLKQELEADAEYGSPWIRWEATLSKSQILENLRNFYDFQAERIESISVTKRKGNGQAEILTVAGDGAYLEIEGEYEIRKALSPKQTEIILADGSKVTGMELLPSGYFCCECQAAGFGESDSAEADLTPLGSGEPDNAAADPAQSGSDEPDNRESDSAPSSSGEPDDGEADLAPSGSDESDSAEADSEPSGSDESPDGESIFVKSEEIYLHGGGYGHGRGMSQYGAAAMAEDGKDYREILEYYYGESEL